MDFEVQNSEIICVGFSKFFMVLGWIALLHFPVQSNQQSSMATQLIRVQKGIKENQLYLKTIGSTISNSGDETDKALYKRAILFQIEAEILQMQMDLGKSYSALKRTQSLLLQVYYRILERSTNQIESELNQIALLAKDKELPPTRNYFSLGYRDLAVARNTLLSTKNTRPWLYSIKLVDCMNALHHTKQAERYLVNLSILHAGEVEADIGNMTHFLNKKSEIIRVFSKNPNPILKLHYDSYFKSFEAIDLYDKLWQEANLSDLESPLEGFDLAYKRNDPPLPIPTTETSRP